MIRKMGQISLLAFMVLGHTALVGAAQDCADGSEPVYWVAPMDPDFRRDVPGKSPMGMDLIPYCENASSSADVQIDPAMVQNLGIKTATIELRVLSREIPVVGQIVWDESRLQRINTRAAGWIEQLGVASSGERVAPGQLMYAVYSPELYAAESEYLAAADSNVLRDAAAARLQALAYTPEQISALGRRGKATRLHSVQATQDRRVVQLNQRVGDYVQPNMPIMTLGDLSRVWVIVQLPEHDADRVFIDQLVTLTLPALPGESWRGRIAHIHPELDAKTRNLRARVVLDNPQRRIKPGMFASAILHGKASDPKPSVPSAAIIRTPAGSRVIVALGEGRFDVVPVTLGESGAGYSQIQSSLNDGDQVVVSGQFLLDSQANISAEVLRLRHHAQAPASSVGTVVRVNPQRRFITLDHDYIESIAMPPMVMSFDLAPSVKLDGIQAGQQVRFTADSPSQGSYRITSLQELP